MPISKLNPVHAVQKWSVHKYDTARSANLQLRKKRNFTIFGRTVPDLVVWSCLISDGTDVIWSRDGKWNQPQHISICDLLKRSRNVQDLIFRHRLDLTSVFHIASSAEWKPADDSVFAGLVHPRENAQFRMHTLFDHLSDHLLDGCSKWLSG